MTKHFYKATLRRWNTDTKDWNVYYVYTNASDSWRARETTLNTARHLPDVTLLDIERLTFFNEEDWPLNMLIAVRPKIISATQK